MTDTIRPTLPTAAVLAAVDGTEASLRAADWAAEHAALEGRPLAVVLVADDSVLGAPVFTTVPAAPPRHGPGTGRAQEVVREAADRVAATHPQLEVRPDVVHGEVGSALVRLSHDASMVVLGSRGRGTVGSAVLGSVGAHVARHATCPVVVCRPGHPGRVHDGVVVLHDGTDAATPLVARALEIAALRGQPVRVLHCMPETDVWASTLTSLRDSLAPLHDRFPGVPLDIEVLRGDPQQALAARPRPADLVVVGRHPLDTLGRHLGHVNATRVIEHADSPVLVVPQDRSVA